MARHANQNWNFPEAMTWELVPAALLMDLRAALWDIRVELQRANQKLSVLDCPDFRAIPHRLDRIIVNTRKKRRKVTR